MAPLWNRIGLPGGSGAAGARGARRRHHDGPVIFDLARPINDGPQVITRIELREPNAKDLLRWSKEVKPGDEVDGAFEAIALVTGLERRVLEQLAGRDFINLANAAARYFEGL